MSPLAPPLSDYDAVAAAVGAYTEAARTGDTATMRRAFHPDAWIFGYLDEEPFHGPIQILFDWEAQVGPAPAVRTRIVSLDVVGSVASVRLEIENWHGHRFTDFFNLVRFEGEWRIANKIFHHHGTAPASA